MEESQEDKNKFHDRKFSERVSLHTEKALIE